MERSIHGRFISASNLSTRYLARAGSQCAKSASSWANLQKYLKGLTVAGICRLECSDVARAQLVCSYQRASAPFESSACELSEEQVRHKAGVSTVAVREHVNGDEAMMVAGSNLYRQ